MVLHKQVLLVELFLISISICGLKSATGATNGSIDSSIPVSDEGFPPEFEIKTKLLQSPLPTTNIIDLQLIEFQKGINDVKHNITKMNEKIIIQQKEIEVERNQLFEGYIRNISKQFEEAQKNLVQMNEFDITSSVKAIYNKQEKNFDIVLKFADEIDLIPQNFFIYSALSFEMANAGHSNPLQSIKLVKSLRRRIIDQFVYRGTEFKTRAKFLVNNVNQEIKTALKKMLKDAILSGQCGLSDELAFEVVSSLQYKTIKEMIAAFVHNVSDQVGSEKLISFIKSFTQDELIIYGYISVYFKLRSNDPALFQLYANLKNLTWHNPEPNSVVVTDYEFLIKTIERAVKIVLGDAMLPYRDRLSDEFFIKMVSSLQYGMIKEIIADAVHNVFNHTTAKKLISSIESFTQEELIISGYTAVFNEMRQNDLAIFQLYANLKNLTWHNPERNSALITDYETLIQRIKIAMKEVLKSAMLLGVRTLLDEFAITRAVSSLKYGMIKDVIADAVHDVVNRIGTKRLISSIKSFTHDGLIISGYTAVYNEMRQNDPALFQLYANLKNLTLHNPERNSALITDYEVLIKKIKIAIVQLLEDAMLSDQHSLSDEFAIEIAASLQYGTIKEIIADAVHNVFNRTGAKKLISSIKSFTQDELIISGYRAVYDEMQQNDSALFQLAADLKNLTWHNPEQNSALVSDYETLKNKIPELVMAMVSSSQVKIKSGRGGNTYLGSLYSSTSDEVGRYYLLNTDPQSHTKWSFEHEKDDIFAIKHVVSAKYLTFSETPDNDCRKAVLSRNTDPVGNNGKWKVTLEGSTVQLKNVLLNEYLFNGDQKSHIHLDIGICAINFNFNSNTTTAETLWEIEIV